MRTSAERAAVKAWKPPVPGIREVFHAQFTDHAYPRHTHEVWTLFVVDEGVIRYDLERTRRGATLPMVTLLPPHVAHDGRPATSGGYRKRVLYLETGLLGEELIGPAVDNPIIADHALRARVGSLHDALHCADELLEAETRLHFLVERVRRWLGAPAEETPDSRHDELAEQLRGLLDTRLYERVTIAAAAQQIGASPAQLARSFSQVFGISPHSYVLGRRLEAARLRILDGEPLADVALAVGFYDQAHLTRHFRNFLGTTPGRFGPFRSRIG